MKTNILTSCYKCKHEENGRCTIAPLSYSLISFDFDNDVFKCEGYKPKEEEEE